MERCASRRWVGQEGYAMKFMKKLMYSVVPPCDKCPYKLGLVRTVVSPCPSCQDNGYQAFEMFTKKTFFLR